MRARCGGRGRDGIAFDEQRVPCVQRGAGEWASGDGDRGHGYEVGFVGDGRDAADGEVAAAMGVGGGGAQECEGEALWAEGRGGSREICELWGV